MKSKRHNTKPCLEQSTCALLKSLGLSVVLAGGMVVGGASVAGAAVTWGADEEVSITGAEIENGNTQATYNAAKSLTIVKGGSLTLNAAHGQGGGIATDVANIYGTLNMVGNSTYFLTLAGGPADDRTYTGTYTFHNGSTVNMTGGATIGAKHMYIDGGIISISGNASAATPGNGDWRKGSQIYATDTFTIANVGTKVNLGDTGYLMVENDGLLTIKDGAEVAFGTATGNAGLIRIGGTTGIVQLDNAAKISVAASKAGVIAASTVNATTGYIEVASTGKLEIIAAAPNTINSSTMTTATAIGTTVTSGIVNISQAVMHNGDTTGNYALPTGVAANVGLKTGDLTINGGTVNVSGNAYVAGQALKLATGTLNIGGDLYAKFGIVSPTSGNLNVTGTWITRGTGSEGMNITANGGSAITLGAMKLDKQNAVDAPQLILNGASAGTQLTFLGLGADKDFLSGEGLHTTGIAITQGSLQLGNGNESLGGQYTGTVAMNGASANNANIVVNGGAWTLGTLNLTTVNANNTLTVTSGQLNIGSITATGSNGGNAIVKSTGKLQVKFADVATDTTATALGKVIVAGGGELVLTGKDKLSSAHYKTLITALLGDDNGSMGTLTLQGTTIDFDPADFVTGSDTTLKDSAVVNGMNVGDKLVQSTVSNGSVDAKGVTSSGLVLTGTTADTPVNVTINGGTLGLNGTGGSFITADKANVQTNVTVADNKTLALTGTGTLNGNVTLSAANSALVVQGNATGALVQVGDIIATAGTVTVADRAQLNAEKLDMTAGTVTINGGGSLNLGELALGGNTASLVVGNQDSAGSVTANKVSMKGGSMFLDPAWVTGSNNVNGASNASLVFTDSKVDGLITVGQNSWVALGTADKTWFPAEFNRSKLSWAENGVTAALALFSPQILHASNGGIVVDGSLKAQPGSVTANSLTLNAHSLLAVNAGNMGGKAALTSTAGTASIDASAKLLLIDATAGQKVLVLDGFTGTPTDPTKNTFVAANIRFNNVLLMHTGDATITTGKLELTPEFNGAALEELRIAGLGQGGGHIAQVYMTQTGTPVRNAFMENALSTSLHGDNLHSMAMSLEAGLDTARAVDTMGAGMMTVSATSSLTLDRAAGNNSGNSVGLSGGAASGLTFGLWGMPTYAHESLDNADIDGTSFRVDSKTNTYGGIIGADLTFGAEQNYRVGAAFNVGAGDSEATHDGIKTENDFDYVGGALYAAGMYDKFRLAGIIGYTAIDNDIKQNQLGGQLKSKPDADIWNFGVEASYTFTFGDGINVIPSLGLEWLHYSQDSYNTTLNNVAVVNVASASANRVNLPIGVKLNKTFALGSTSSITPEVRAAIIPSFGSDMDTNASLPGIIGANGSMKGINTDNVAGEIGVGLSVNLNQNFSLAAGYDLQFSKNRTNHNVNAMLRVKF